MGEADAVFLSLFSTDVEASMLACDEAGIVPDELLYLPRAVFFAGVESEEQGLIRYNMRERFRQEMFRKVFGLKKAILLKGNVASRWRERNQIFPDASLPPDLTAIRRKVKLDDSGNVIGEEDVGELDTESDDDGLDEYFRPKPPPPLPAAVATPAPAGGASASGGPAASAPFVRGWGTARGGAVTSSTLSLNAAGGGAPPGTAPGRSTAPLSGSMSLTTRGRKNVEPPPPPPPPIPRLPREPPRCRTLTSRNLKREQQNLEVSRMRLARYGSKVDKVVAMTVERENSRSPQRQRTFVSQPPASVSPTASTSSSLFPRIPLSAREAKRQLSAVVRQTMLGIAESAINYNAYREELLDREEDEMESSAAHSTRRATAAAMSREMWFAQAEARKQREEEQKTAEALLAQEYQRYTMEKQHRMQNVLAAKHRTALLSTEVLRMKQLFAQEKRECMLRREETRVQRVVARSEPKHQYAEFILMRRKMEAESSRQQHIQLELLRKELKETVNRMNAKNDWEMPPLLEDLIVTSQRRRSSEMGGITPPSGDDSRSATTMIH